MNNKSKMNLKQKTKCSGSGDKLEKAETSTAQQWWSCTFSFVATLMVIRVMVGNVLRQKEWYDRCQSSYHSFCIVAIVVKIKMVTWKTMLVLRCVSCVWLVICYYNNHNYSTINHNNPPRWKWRHKSVWASFACSNHSGRVGCKPGWR